MKYFLKAITSRKTVDFARAFWLGLAMVIGTKSTNLKQLFKDEFHSQLHFSSYAGPPTYSCSFCLMCLEFGNCNLFYTNFFPKMPNSEITFEKKFLSGNIEEAAKIS